MADRFWVGGSNSWNTTANWSATSGGAGGASIPTSADNVFFNASSSAGSYTVTFSGGTPTCANITIGAPATGTLTLSGFGSIPINIYGSWTSTGTGVVCNSAYSTGALGAINFLGTGTQTITMGGLTLYAFGINYSGGGTYVHTDDFYNAAFTGAGAISSCGITTLSLGTVDISAGALYKVTTFKLGVSSNVRIIAFGTNRISLIGTNTTVVDVSYGTNFSYTGTGGFTCVASPTSGTRSFVSWSGFNQATAVNIAINGGSDVVALNNNNGASYGTVDFTGFSGTWAYLAATMNLFGNIYLSPTMTLTSGTPTRYVFFKSTNAGAIYYIKSSGKSWPYSLTLQSSANYTLFDNCVANVPGVPFQHSGGNLDLNGKILTIDYWQGSGSGSRGFNFGNTGQSALVITGSNETVWNQGITGTLYLLGNSNIHLNNTSNVGTRTLSVGTSISSNQNSYPKFIIDNGNDIVSLNGFYSGITFANSFSGNLANTSFTMYGDFTYSANTLYTGAGTMTFTGANTANIQTNGEIPGHNLSLAGSGNVTLVNGWNSTTNLSHAYCNVRNTGNVLNFLAVSLQTSSAANSTFDMGNTNITVTSINAAANVTPFSITNAANITFINKGNVVVPAGSIVPTTFYRNITAGVTTTGLNAALNYDISGNDSVKVSGLINDVNWSTFTGNVTVGNTLSLTGNLIVSGNNQWLPQTTTSNIYMVGSNKEQTLDLRGYNANGITFYGNAVNSNVTLANGWSSNSTFTVINGNINVNNQNVTANTFFGAASAGNATLNFGDGTWTLLSNSNPWTVNAVGNLTTVPANSTLYFRNDRAGNTQFTSQGNLTYGNIVIGGSTANSNFQFIGTSGATTSLNNLSANKANVPWKLMFTPGTTTAVNSWNISGTSSGNMVTLTSTTAAVHYLNYTGNSNVETSWMNISYSSASPSSGTWYSLLSNDNINSGNNTGWIFIDTGSSNFFLVF